MTQPPEYPAYPGPEQPSVPPPAGGQVPPPPGYQPPPPPGYQQPPQQPYGVTPTGSPWGEYAGWWSRVGASILDGLIGMVIGIVPLGVGAILAFKDVETDPLTDEITGGVDPLGIVIMGLGVLAIVAFGIWNTVFRQGRKGQTVGKSVLGVQVVKAETGQFLGAGMAFLRWILSSILGQACFLNYLWPLWDKKHQTWHDMIVSSVVVKK